MKLPPGLAPWASQLKIFPNEVSVTLGELARRISAFVSPFKPLGAHDDGEPNGYDGVARRGIYDRLLLSELALADEFSDEFVRRAVMGEHLFLNLARVAEGEKRISVVLFDAGAMQLGTPRLAHLAAFIAFARRAEAAHAAFCWGVLQDTKQLILADGTEASIKILLESRVARAVSEDDINEWDAKLADVRGRADVWLVGSEVIGLLEGASEFSHLFIDEILHREKRELAVRVKSASGIEKHVFLELPSDELCTWILRNPFELRAKPVASPTFGMERGDFFFDGFGSKLLMRASPKSVKCLNIHNISEKVSPPIEFTYEKSPLIAAGRVKRAVVGAQSEDKRSIRLVNLKEATALLTGLYRSNDVDVIFPDDRIGLWRMLDVRPRGFHKTEIGLIDGAGSLFFLKPRLDVSDHNDGIAGSLELVATDVHDAIVTSHGLQFVGRDDDAAYHSLVKIGHKVEHVELGYRNLRNAFFGRGEHGRTLLTVEDQSGNWEIFDENYKRIEMPRPQGKVVGVLKDPRVSPRAGRLEIGDDGRALIFCDSNGTRKILMIEKSEIRTLKANPFSPTLAYQTVDGAFVLWSYAKRQPIFVFRR